jgi:DNA polymerase I-like protein with 3'-5' exonuclease and polymerase domains
MNAIPSTLDLDIKDGDTVAVDLETYDPELKTHGSGAIKKKGKVCGIAVAYRDKKFYFPIAHLNRNLGPRNTWKALNKKIFQNEKVIKVFHNAMYDVCWIRSATGLMPIGPIYDTMIAASVIDENRMRYTLDSLAKDYLGDSKYKHDLAEKSKEEHGISDPMSNMHKLPYDLVVDYAEQDVFLTLKLWNKFKGLIKSEVKTKSKKIKTLENIFDIETRLFPCLVDMRFKGVRVDEEKTKTFGKDIEKEKNKILKKIKEETGISVDVWAADSIKPLLDKLGIDDFKVTPKTGRASITKLYLENHTNKYLKMIAEARQLDKLYNTFVSGILKHIHEGRIHADINQIRSDSGGTVTGRFSMSNPNLQQIPSKSELGSKIRQLFLPEEGHEWASFDYSQQEPRLVVHYALKNGFEGAEVMAEAYKKDPKTDFHKIVAEMAKITRKQAKTINLGLFYGMGKGKLAKSLELDKEEAEELFDQYHTKVPFVRKLSKGLQEFAEENKNIFTLEDRFCRFDRWEPINKEWNKEKGVFEISEYKEVEGKMQIVKSPVPILKTVEAQNRYHADLAKNSQKSDPNCNNFEQHYRPAFTYKALNRLIQGSAADMTKKAMVELYELGIVPHIQIHDELCFSIKTAEESKIIQKTMENSICLEVPNKVDFESGENWGSIQG